MDWANRAAGVACGNPSGRNVPVDHTARADDRAGADRYPRQHLGSCTDPHIVADGDRIGIFQSKPARLGIERMPCGVKPAVWGDKDIVTKGYSCAVEDDAAMVGKKVFAD